MVEHGLHVVWAVCRKAQVICIEHVGDLTPRVGKAQTRLGPLTRMYASSVYRFITILSKEEGMQMQSKWSHRASCGIVS